MERIIDAHSHLGDILYPGGGSLIAKIGIEKRAGLDLVSLLERNHYKDSTGLGKLLYRLAEPLITRGERARNATATLENFVGSMDAAGIDFSVALPVPPHVRFADLRPHSERNERIAPVSAKLASIQSA